MPDAVQSCAVLSMLRPASVLSGFSRTAVAQESDLDPRIVKLVAPVSEERLGVILKKLESFETRSTLSSTTSTDARHRRGAPVDSRRDEELQPEAAGQLRHAIRCAKQGRITRDVELRNVMAILPGRSPRRIYISGHYDTVARPGGQGAANAGGPRRSRRAHARRRPIPTRRSTTSRPA